MKIALLRVGIDSGCGGIDGPIFADRSFELMPIPDTWRLDHRTYGNALGRSGLPLVEYFPPARRAAMSSCTMHVDPEFTTFTYGDPTSPKAGLRKLQKGDLLVFYAGLLGHGCVEESALFLVGLFEVEFAGIASTLSKQQIEACSENFHVRHLAMFEEQRSRLVLVKGGAGSRLLKYAVKISAVGHDKSGRPLKVLSPEMPKIFGTFGGRISIQRSPPRWVAAECTAATSNFLLELT